MLKDPESRLAGPFGTMPQEPWHLKRARRNAKQVPWSYSTTDKCAPLEAWQPEQWRVSTTETNTPLLTDELLRVTSRCLLNYNQIFKKVPYNSPDRNLLFCHKIGEIFHLLDWNELVETFGSTDLFVFCLTTVSLALT